jgi:glycosyl transferase family 87
VDTESTAGKAELAPERKSRRDRGWTVAGIVILSMVWTLAIAHARSVVKTLQYRSFPCDFCSFYSSDLALRAGVNPYKADLPAIESQLGTNSRIPHATEPPTQLLLFEPFTWFSLPTGYWIWIALNALALAASLGLLLGPRSGLTNQIASILVALAILYTPVGIHFQSAQNKFFTLLTLVLMMRCMEEGYDGSAGLLLAFAGLTRIFPFVLGGYLLIRRRWRVMLYAAAGSLLFGALTVVCFGATNSLSFLHLAVATSMPLWDNDINASSVTLVSRMFWHSGYSGPAFEWLRITAVAISVVLVLAVTTLATLKQPIAQDRDWRAFSLWIITSVMLFPSSKRYYLVMLLIPFAALAAAAAHTRASRRAIAMAIVSYILIRYPGQQASLFGLVGSHIAGVRGVLGSACFPLLAAYISIYWLITDEPRDVTGSAEMEPARSR